MQVLAQFLYNSTFGWYATWLILGQGFRNFCINMPKYPCFQQVLAQFLYTSIFGWYATWLFVRSGHLAAPIAVHAACNALGFPDFERMSR